MEHRNAIIGHFCNVMSWMFTALNPQAIPIILSSILSIMGIINYYFSIKKNRK